MENEQDVTVETQNDTVEETVETPVTDTTDEAEAEPEVDVAQLQATNKKLYERAKKAEADLKALKTSKPVEAKTSPANVEETVLLANGMPEELVEKLKKVAQVTGTSLIKAQNDPIFVAVKSQFEKEKKQTEASMPASRSSGAVKAKKTFTTPGLTREEHMEMVKNSL